MRYDVTLQRRLSLAEPLHSHFRKLTREKNQNQITSMMCNLKLLVSIPKRRHLPRLTSNLYNNFENAFVLKVGMIAWQNAHSSMWQCFDL